jgi:thiaminase/transcriptional activator TenA
MAGNSFFARLRAENAETHHRALEHPTVLGIGDGTLSDDTFRYYLEQDYQFLLRYVRVIARAVASSPDLPTSTQLAELLHSTLAVEIDALVELYRAFGGERPGLDEAEPAPACQAYTDHLLATSSGGSLLVILAAMLPCQWGYGEIGRALHARGLPADPRFARWIEEYASAEYGALVEWVVARFDALATAAGSDEREQARRAFALSTRYELAFWEMAGRREHWATSLAAAARAS